MNRTFKEDVLIFLKERKLNELADVIIKKKSQIKNLLRLLYSTDAIIRWRAIEAVGVVVDKLVDIDYEAARNIIRSMFWSINDESGGIGWSAPECIGEIIYRRPKEFSEFASIIISNTDEEMLLRGVLWAAGRIAQAEPELVRSFVPELIKYIDDPDPVVRGYTLRLLHIIGEKAPFDNNSYLLGDTSIVPVYENGILKEVSVAELARLLCKC
ncbi:DVU0298 family protein [Desulfotruncus alcoholivorax]|uniref:DVU0298 family protein n=1 Tax=Desulfotruncus alcoholivorax TaxID=265477 RepID=UPI0004238369|nr:DVU0298 family protein [Desulfotruncus alcoholivorax]